MMNALAKRPLQSVQGDAGDKQAAAGRLDRILIGRQTVNSMQDVTLLSLL